MTQINVNFLLQKIKETEEVAMRVLVTEVSAARKPFVQADIKSARKVLDRLQEAISTSEVSSTSILSKVIED